VIITRGPEALSFLRHHAAGAGCSLLRSTVFNVGRAVVLGAALATLIFSAGSAFADELDNGSDFQFADTTGDPYYDATLNPTSVQIADQFAPFGFGAESGTVESSVWLGSSNNPYDVNGGGDVTGALTFVYQINLTSTGGDIASLGAADFGFNMTDVGYYDQTGFETWPSYVSRDLSGASDTISTVTFSFFNNGGQYSTVNGTAAGPENNGGEPSALLVVNTDATTYSPSTITLQDDSNGTATSYAINSYNYATPEPGSIVLMVLGLTGLLTVARARRSSRIAAQAAC